MTGEMPILPTPDTAWVEKATAELLSLDEIKSQAVGKASLCGVYFLILENEIVYVGQSQSVFTRLNGHKAAKEKDFDRFAFVPIPIDLLGVMEALYIRKFRPRYNFDAEQGRKRRREDRGPALGPSEESSREWLGQQTAYHKAEGLFRHRRKVRVVKPDLD